MADDDPMFLGKVDDALEKVLARRRRGGVIRVVEEHQFGFSRDIQPKDIVFMANAPKFDVCQN